MYFLSSKVWISSTKSPEKWQNPQKSGKIPGKVAEKKPLFKPRETLCEVKKNTSSKSQVEQTMKGEGGKNTRKFDHVVYE